MLKLRRARVVRAGATPTPEQDLMVVLDGDDRQREAIAQTALVGECAEGDDVVVNVEARDLGLGSGGFDIVHVNLTRGLRGQPTPGTHVMKLNYTSLQHSIEPVEGEGNGDAKASAPRMALPCPAAVLALHGQLAAVAWSFARGAPGRRLGYVQTPGGALPGGHSRVVRRLLAEGRLADHVTAGACFGGQREAISTAGALHYGFTELGWDAAVCGPGPGIVGSGSSFGHGGMSALDSAHAALAVGCATVLVPRMSSGDPRSRHRGLSHHTLTVLDLLLEPVTVALPQGLRSPVGAELGAGLRAAFGRGAGREHTPAPTAPEVDLGEARPARIARHDWRRMAVDLPGYAASGLPAVTMGRTLMADPLFFGAALAGGAALAALGHHAAGIGEDQMHASDEEQQ